MTKSEKILEDLFEKEIRPLMKQMADVCTKHKMPLITAVQIFVSKKDGARMAAQVVESRDASNAMLLASKILQGEAKITAHPDKDTYLLKLDFGECDFESGNLQMLLKHAENCTQCADSLDEILSKGELGEGAGVFVTAEEEDDSPIPFIIGKNNTIH